MVGQLVVMADLTQGTTASYTSYVPSLIEIMVGAGVVAYGALAVTLGIRYLRVVDHSGVEELAPQVEEFAPARQPSLAGD